MTQELIDLRNSILEGRYEDALVICEELEWMSKKGILINIESFLIRIMIHLIKNQVEQRLTNSWAASISESIKRIQKLNIKENKTSYYLNIGEWQPILEEALADAIRPASAEVMNGYYSPFQLGEMVDKNQIILIAKQLLELTYSHSGETLLETIDNHLTELPGGQDWKEGRH
jgi:Domain of unknown function DUF29